jgi:TolB-like protein
VKYSRRTGWCALSLLLLGSIGIAAPGSATTEAIGIAPADAPRLFAATFENDTGEEQYDPAAAGMADVMSAMLTQQAKVKVVERQQLLAITREQAASLKGLTGEKHSLEAGKILGAQRVMTGRVYLADGKLTVQVKILDLATARVLAAEQEGCRPEELLEAAAQLARRLGKSLELPLKEVDVTQIDKSPLAGLHFGKALSHYYAGNMDAAIMQFMRTSQLDPDLVEAHYFCGLAYWKLRQPRDAIVEWKIFLRRAPGSLHEERVKKLMLQAEEAAANEHAIPRMGEAATRKSDVKPKKGGMN